MRQRTRTGQWLATLAAAGASLWLGCAGSAEVPVYPPAAERAIDIYAEPPAAPSSPLANGEDALAVVLRDEALIRHLRRMDANYSGRRRKALAWTGGAEFRTEPEVAEGGEGKPASDVQEAIAQEGGYWLVRVRSDVRETQIFYVCELRIVPSGRPLAGFEPRDACRWRDTKAPATKRQQY